MCTAVSFKKAAHYFGRNLDLDYSYDEQVTICPRNYSLDFRNGECSKSHYAMIGMATTVEGYPLFYDATNECGLSMAGLNFPQNAHYFPTMAGKVNIASFEFIPWLLGHCASVEEALEKCEHLNLTDEAFSKDFPPSPLHWLLSDRNRSVTIESMADGLHIYDNPVGVLTNNPPFPMQLFQLNHYRQLSPKVGENRFLEGTELEIYSLGMGGLGLPGDLSSTSRFVRAVFTKHHAVCEGDEESAVSQFFHILRSVYQVKGLCYVDHSGKYEFTLYSSCVNTDRGIYYYVTYGNSTIHAVDMHREDLDSQELIRYPLKTKMEWHFQDR